MGRERTRTTSMSASAGCARPGWAVDVLVEDAMRTRVCDVSVSSASASS